ncbi:DNA adenine methylase [Acinetobacter baumannii]|uniref:site-specific DNA-methyltransferase (adenine-specific) n=1 Tax=Acinetobacter baumannii TaxID=470 RepID=A0A1S2G1H8_ACIBA|nr:DNA adenine methylase [Acinetobacter baumannii]MCE6436499.1 DNA adenine methylase [Acinetobacter baumannii]MCE6824053.1 DNA adenine methylase [Acinetobacter baumannii]MCE6827848.1 DNA adenine methylase [Acinetobacter baumannii]MCE6850410.1 DNA adenine methylase [Acinetobacter baumannii]MCZ0626754.1 DNA adenine methylase [Acinetobacter baumannii]
MNVQYNPQGHSFSGWLGGKSQLARTIIELMPEHKTYVEVFGGAGWVLFKKSPSTVEVINDVNDDLINLYRVLKFHFDAFLTEFDLLLFSRTIFDDMKKNDRGLTDIQRAAKFYYLLRAAFSCQLDGAFSYSKARKAGLKLGDELRTHLHSVHERLQGVVIENASYDYVINRMDSPDTLFYLDPPYWNCEKDYGKNIFGKEDFFALKDHLSKIQGKFILSLNDVPEVRELFKEFTIQNKKIRWTVNNKAAAESHNGNELIICNF